MNKTITVKGRGKALVKPDLITVSIRLEARDMEYQAAMSKAAAQLSGLQGAIASAGFSREEMKTGDFNVRTEYNNVRDENNNYRQVFGGYVCSHGLSLEFPLDMERLPRVLGAIAGSEAAPEFSIAFTVKDKNGVREELLRSAAANASSTAGVLAQASGVRLGELVNIDYNWGEPHLASPTTYRMEKNAVMACADQCAMEMTPEDINVTDNVTFTWTIE